MSDYVPSVGMARARYCDSIARKDVVSHSFMVTAEEHAKNHAEFDRMIAEVERAAAARALEEAAYEIFVHPVEVDPGKRMAFHRVADAVYDALRARAEAYRQERGER